LILIAAANAAELLIAADIDAITLKIRQLPLRRRRAAGCADSRLYRLYADAAISGRRQAAEGHCRFRYYAATYTMKLATHASHRPSAAS